MQSYHITKDGIYAGDGSVKNEPPYLEWLLGHHHGQPRMLYDLDGSVAALLRLIEVTREEGEKLLRDKQLQLESYRITYFPNKFFGIDKGEHGGHLYANFSNAAEYSEPHYTGAENIEEDKNKALGAMAVSDSILLLYRSLGLDTAMASPVSAFMKKYKLNIPLASDMEGLDDVITMAHESVKGNWVEAWKRGYWDHAYDYDIVSAYPSELSKLFDIRRGEWVNEKNPPDNAVYGFARGILTTGRELHPFLYRDKTRQNINVTITPVGSRQDVLPLEKIRLIKEYDLGKWKPSDGWFWIPKGPQYEVLKGPITYLMNNRPAAGVGREIVKRIASGIWGKMLETHTSDTGRIKLGGYYNPIYGSIVENAIQVKVTKACLDNNTIPLQIAVDGIISDKALKLDIGQDPGKWRLSHEGRCLILSAGLVGFEGKGGSEEFSLTFEWLNDQIKAKPKAKEYKMVKYTPVTLARAINSGWDKLGTVEEVTRYIGIKEDAKRMWMEEPKSGGDLLKKTYSSEPWDCSILGIE